MLKKDKEATMQRLLILTLLASCIVGLTACSVSKDEKLEEYIKEVKSRPTYKIDPMPEIKPVEKFVYPSKSRRDPFLAIKRVSEDNKSEFGPDVNRKKGPLEYFPLDALSMVGMIQQNKKQWALVSAPDKAIYRVSLGEYMGDNYGKIVRITKKSIKLIETVRVSGRWKKKKASVVLIEKNNNN